MRAHARIAAEADGRGGTRLPLLRGESPLLLRHTPSSAGPATVYLIGGAAGPLGGDELRLDIEVGPAAALVLHTVAASLALPGRTGAASRFSVDVSVAAGATLHWLPEPTIAAAGCRHATLARIELADGAALQWRDELICGRHGEPPGIATITTSVRLGGSPLLRQTLDVGPEAEGWAGPAILGAARTTGSLLHVHPGVVAGPAQVLGPTWARLPLAGPASLTTATADDAHTLRRCLTPPDREAASAVRLQVG